jgi:hypothetical protein
MPSDVFLCVGDILYSACADVGWASDHAMRRTGTQSARFGTTQGGYLGG